MARYILCNRVRLHNIELRAGREVMEENADEIRRLGGFLVELPNPVVEARAALVLQQSADGRREAELDILVAAIAEVAQAGGGITPAQHKALRDLIHFIDDGPADGFASGAFKEQLPIGNPFPLEATWYTDNTKTSRIVHFECVRDAQQKPVTEIWQMFDAGGSLLVTLSDAIVYSGIVEHTRTRTWA